MALDCPIWNILSSLHSPYLPTFTVREAASALNLSHGRTHKLVDSLVDLGVLSHWGPADYNRRFAAPSVIDVLLPSDPTKQST